MTRRAPSAALHPFVRQLWSTDGHEATRSTGAIEHALPTGEMHLVFRIGGHSLHLRGADQHGWREAERMLVGGPRSRYYARRPGHGAAVVGAMLHPGASLALFGAAATDFADRHVALADLWNDDATILHQRLGSCATPAQRIDLLERVLEERLARAPRLDPVVAHALQALDDGRAVGAIVAASGLSHRAFIGRFRVAVGLAPKAYASVRRLQRTVLLMTQSRGRDGAAIAQLAGFSDQAHLCREFALLSGVRPGHYLRTVSDRPNHVPVDFDA